ncbi:unnamed protein product [Triticum turgidum subsp. durum]|uniref:Nucleoside diphosphate kinase n=1 Tax=Triticum turgidum subsp. durum TaxID=4567 RepID=A0A9R1AI51_TRITD|nr:unnamed protein product [Triticum turgidum subsp. durum]
MDAMAALARTGPSLAAAGHRSSATFRPSASLSFASASLRSRGRVGLSTAGWNRRATRVARATPNRIVASSEIISRFEKKGFLLKGLKLFQCPKDLAQEHYKDLKERPFFPNLIDYITSGPVVCMAWEGDGVVASARKLIGATNPLQAEPGTIRGDLAVQTGRNVVHGSDSPDNGKREIGLWFKEGELAQWESVQTPWLIE